MNVAGFGVQANAFKVPEMRVESHEVSSADQMKSIRKMRAERQMFEDPGMAKKLVSMEASPVYNASGDLIQSVGSTLSLSV